MTTTGWVRSKPRGSAAPAAERLLAVAADRRRSRRRRWLGALALVAVVGALAWVVYGSSWMRTERVVVEGMTGTDKAAVLSAAQVPTGGPLALVDTARVTTAVSSYPPVARVLVERAWPDTIRITVVPREPAIAISTPQRTFDLADVDGVVYRTVQTAPPEVPVVSAVRGQTRDEGARAALSLVGVLPAEVVEQVSAIRIDAGDRVSFHIGDTTVTWGDDRDPEIKMAVVTALLPLQPKTLDVTVPQAPVTTGERGNGGVEPADS